MQPTLLARPAMARPRAAGEAADDGQDTPVVFTAGREQEHQRQRVCARYRDFAGGRSTSVSRPVDVVSGVVDYWLSLLKRGQV